MSSPVVQLYKQNGWCQDCRRGDVDKSSYLFFRTSVDVFFDQFSRMCLYQCIRMTGTLYNTLGNQITGKGQHIDNEVNIFYYQCFFGYRLKK